MSWQAGGHGTSDTRRATAPPLPPSPSPSADVVAGFAARRSKAAHEWGLGDIPRLVIGCHVVTQEARDQMRGGDVVDNFCLVLPMTRRAAPTEWSSCDSRRRRHRHRHRRRRRGPWSRGLHSFTLELNLSSSRTH